MRLVLLLSRYISFHTIVTAYVIRASEDAHINPIITIRSPPSHKVFNNGLEYLDKNRYTIHMSLRRANFIYIRKIEVIIVVDIVMEDINENVRLYSCVDLL